MPKKTKKKGELPPTTIEPTYVRLDVVTQNTVLNMVGDGLGVAVVTASVTQRRLLYATGFRRALTAAVTEWVETTSAGRVVYQNSSYDLNVGDLPGRPMADPDLVRLLKKRGIYDMKVETHQYDHVSADWDHDDVLINYPMC